MLCGTRTIPKSSYPASPETGDKHFKRCDYPPDFGWIFVQKMNK